MTAYYNEFDPKAAAWLRELIAGGHIAAGEVDERSIADVQPEDLRGFTQCHFFAGIGGWSLALRLAGWPDDRPVWTGSCPCQPFSAAGKGEGVNDPRHLWPVWFPLIRECVPPVVFGEQVASKDGLGWLDLVSADLEGAGYAIGAADLCAAGVGAPHIRQRLWFGAVRLEHASGVGREERRAEPSGRGVAGGCGDERLADADDAGLQGRGVRGDSAGQRASRAGSLARGMADAGSEHLRRGHGAGTGTPSTLEGEARQRERSGVDDRSGSAIHGGRPRPVNGFWRDADWLYCRDGKWRPVEPGTFPLAHGVSGRVGLLRGYGNAIVPEVAATFIGAFEEARAAERVRLTEASVLQEDIFG